MKKTNLQDTNANLPPLMVLGSFLSEKKREFVSSKLQEFGLVRKEIFNKKLGHKKKDFPLKKFFGKRYRFVPAPMTDAEVDQLFEMIQTLLAITPKATTSNGAGNVNGKNKKIL
jgi:DNA-binding transcriptional regulator GbsR (MarR family)